MMGRAVVIAGLVMLASCGGYDLQSVHVEPEENELFVGDTLDLRAIALYSGGIDGEGTGKSVADRSTWSSSNFSIASVSNVGRVVAHKAGSVTVEANFDHVGSPPVNVRITPVIDSIHVAVTNSQPTVGDSVILQVTTHDASGVEVPGVPVFVFDAASTSHFVPFYSARKRSPNALKYYASAAGDFILQIENIHSLPGRVHKTYVPISVRPKP